MTKHQLLVEYDYDFDLIGISCQIKDYRLSWALNQKFNFKLSKEHSDLEIKLKKENRISKHSIYCYYNDATHTEYSLIENKGRAGYLIPAQTQTDYFLIIKNNHDQDISDILTRIKEIEYVLTASLLDVSKLKDKENLIF